MKRTFIMITAMILLGGCGYFKTKPHLELSADMPYVLHISDFEWSYGTIEINKFKGDFEGLDHEVFDLLKGKQGICSIYIDQKSKDKYGAESSSSKYTGTIELKELNKFESWEYWHKEVGLRRLIYNHIVNPPRADSAKMDSVVMDNTTIDTATRIIPVQPPASIQPAVQSDNSNEYHFGIDDLYPTDEKPSLLPQNRFVITGSIAEASFDNAVFLVTASGGDQVVLKFYPQNMKADVLGKLQQALKPGYAIKCVGVKIDSTTYDLLAAKITIQ